MSTQPNSIWLIEGIVDEAKSLWKEGLSANQIANALSAKFKVNVTRNACIGKLFRERQTGHTRRSHPSRKQAIAGQAKWAKPPARIIKPKVCKPMPLAPENVVMLNPKRLVDIGRSECRWVCDDADLMCANACEGESSWCSDHSALVHWRPEKRVMTGNELARSLRRYADR